MALASAVKALARALGFDLAGVASAAPTDRAGFLLEWLERGYGGAPDGPLAYVARRVAERTDPRTLLPGGARSLVAVALSYAEGAEPRDAQGAFRAQPGHGPRIARYAQGDDYHGLIADRLRALAAGVEVLADRAVESRVWVDTGPVLERVVAVEAGLGWQGKNTMLIHPELGSYVFLGVLATDLPLAPDAPQVDHCGGCRACLDACPTDAFPEPYVLDATRCIAYTTIEDPGPVPEPLRLAQGDRLFGCDVCQDVCPWNGAKRVIVPDDPLGLRARLLPREAWRAPTLAWVLDLDEDAWRNVTRHSALRRARWRGLLRNALVVAGNSGDAGLRPRLEAHARGEDPMLAEHARWALGRLDSTTAAPRGERQGAQDGEQKGGRT